MRYSKTMSLIAAAATLAACDVKFGDHDKGANATGNVSAAGKSEEGQLSVSAPGFEMKMNIPESIRAEAGMDNDNGLIYPNAQFSGIHVEGGRAGGQNGSDGEVELRFTSNDAPDAIARWYADPARAPNFAVGQSGRDGADFLVAGTTKENEGQFRVRLSPKSGGGTDGRVVLSDRN